MLSISSSLLQQLQQTLLRCGPFNDYEAIRVLFSNQKLYGWRDDLPHKSSPSSQVVALIDLLIEQSTADGENALLVFVQVLHDSCVNKPNCYQQLQELEVQLREQLTLLPTTYLKTKVVDEIQVADASSEGDLNKALEERLKLGDLSEATKICSELLSLTKQNPEYLLKFGHILNRQSNFTDARLTLESLLANIEPNGNCDELKARIYLELGRTYTYLGNHVIALDSMEKGFSFFGINIRKAETATLKNAEHHLLLPRIAPEHLDDIARGLRYTGLAYIRQHKPIVAITCWASAKNLWLQSGAQQNVAAMHLNISAVYVDHALSLPRAKKHLDEAQPILQSVQEAVQDLLRLYNNKAYLQFRLAEYYPALTTINQAWPAADSFLSEKSELLDNQGNIYTALGAWEQALNAFSEAIYICEQIGDKFAKILSMINKAYLYLSWGRALSKSNLLSGLEQYKNARKLFDLCFQYIREWEVESEEVFPIERAAFVKIGSAEVFLANNELERAEIELQSIEYLSEDNNAPYFLRGLIWRLQALILWRKNELILAKEKLLVAQSIFKVEPDKFGKSEYEDWVANDLRELEETAHRQPPKGPTKQPLIDLVNALNQLFDMNELKVLCFELNVDYEQIEGTIKRTWVISLVNYMERWGRVEELKQWVKKLRPNAVL